MVRAADVDTALRGTRPEESEVVAHAYWEEGEYDANGNITRVEVENRDSGADIDLPSLGIVANPSWVSTRVYDLLDQMVTLTKEIDPTTDAVWQFGYDANGNVVSVTEPDGDIVASTYDERDMLASVTDGAGSPVGATKSRAAGGVRLKDGSIATSCPMAAHRYFRNLLYFSYTLFFLYARRRDVVISPNQLWSGMKTLICCGVSVLAMGLVGASAHAVKPVMSYEAQVKSLLTDPATVKGPSAASKASKGSVCGVPFGANLDAVVKVWGKPTGIKTHPKFGLELWYGHANVMVTASGTFKRCRLDARLKNLQRATHKELGITIGQPKARVRAAVAKLVEDATGDIWFVKFNTYGLTSLEFEPKTGKLRAMSFDTANFLAYDPPIPSALTGAWSKRMASLFASPASVPAVGRVAFQQVGPRVAGLSSSPTIDMVVSAWGRPSRMTYRAGQAPHLEWDFGSDGELSAGWRLDKVVRLVIDGGSHAGLAQLAVAPKGVRLGANLGDIETKLGAPKKMSKSAYEIDLNYGTIAPRVTMDLHLMPLEEGKPMTLRRIGLNFLP